MNLFQCLYFGRAQGGSCNIFVNDDGLAVVSEEERVARIAYYESNNIAYCARPPHKKDGYIRYGRFKKASNMNFCLNLSEQVSNLVEQEGLHLEDALKRVSDECPHNVFMNGDVQIGAFILLVDSDTRVPEDCIAPTVTELTHSENVAFTQHATSPMQVTYN